MHCTLSIDSINSSVTEFFGHQTDKKKIQFHNFVSPEAVRSNPNSSVWQRFVNFWSENKESLSYKINAIKTGKQIFPIEEKLEILINAFQSKDYPKLCKNIKEIILNLQSDECLNLIRHLSIKAYATQKLEICQRCSDLLPLEKLQEIARFIQSESVDAKKIAKKIAQILPYLEKYRFEKTNNFLQDELKKQRPVVVSFFYNLINTLMSAVNLIEIGKSPGTYFETKYMLDIYWRFLSIPIMLLQLLQCYFLNPLTTFFVFSTVSLVVTAAMYVYFKWLQPCPDELTHFTQNLTTEAKKGNLEPVLGRDQEIDDLISSLIAAMNGSNKHPLLYGNTGVGKTQIVNGLAQRISDGNVPEILKGKKLFSLNVSNLIPSDGGFQLQTPLMQLADAIGKHKDNIILFLDEIQTAVSTEKNAAELGNELRKKLDFTPGSLPLCIAATTKKEYDQLIAIEAQEPLARRFKLLHINEMDEKQTVTVLRGLVQREAAELTVNDERLFEICKMAKQYFPKEIQPGKSKEMLASAIGRIKNNPLGDELRHELRKKITKKEEISSKLARQTLDIAFLHSTKFQKDLKKLQKIEESINRINLEIKAKEKKFQDYLYLKKERHYLEQKIYSASQEILSSNENNRQTKNEKEILFAFYILLPMLDDLIKKIVTTYDLKVEITQEIIEPQPKSNF